MICKRLSRRSEAGSDADGKTTAYFLRTIVNINIIANTELKLQDIHIGTVSLENWVHDPIHTCIGNVFFLEFLASG